MLTTTPHLNLPGTARAALDLYASAFGGQATVTTYAQLGMPPEAPGAEAVVFGLVVAPNGFRVMAYDIPGRTTPFESTTRREQGVTITDQPVFVSVRGESLEEVSRCWAALAEGAEVIEPLGASAWSAGFGMLTDRFGVTWVLDVAAPGEG